VPRPWSTFDGEDLYQDLASKAGALMHSLALNHPFVDGNKRVAAHAALLFLLLNEQEFVGSVEDLVSIALATASGQVAAEALAIWFRQRLRAVE
jgi:death-on-curing protein